MDRRLYFLLPGADPVQKILEELLATGIDRQHIHVVAQNPERLSGLPADIQAKPVDPAQHLERRLWNLNLGLFAVALVAFVAALYFDAGAWAVLPLAVMVATFIAGMLFTHVPNTHLDEFRDALRHGELLLVVDGPRGRVKEIEDLVHRHHPEAAVGGVGWSKDTLHI